MQLKVLTYDSVKYERTIEAQGQQIQTLEEFFSRPDTKSFAKVLTVFARRKEIDAYLKTGFVSKVSTLAGEPQKKQWLKLKLIDISLLEHFWKIVEGSRLDYSDCEFKDTPSKGGKRTFK